MPVALGAAAVKRAVTQSYKDGRIADFAGQREVQDACKFEGTLRRRVSVTRRGSVFEERIQEVMEVGKQPANDTRTLDLVICSVIVLNAIFIVLEVDLGPRDPHVPIADRAFWFVAESLFTVAYIVELVVRIWQQRERWILSGWNWFDAFLVVVSVVDSWILIFVLGKDMAAFRLIQFLRIVRLTRLVRLIRLVRMFRGLYIMVQAYVTAMASLFWIVVLMALGILLSATFTTIVIGHNDGLRHVQIRGISACDMFGTVPRSSYTLFELMTLEDWHEVGRPLVNEQPLFFIFIFGFIITFTFGILNMIIGMIVEKTLTFAKKQDDSTKDETKKRLVRDLSCMREIFMEADKSGSGMITVDTFRTALEDQRIRDILKGLDIPTDDALELLVTLDPAGAGHLTVGNFLEGIAKLRGAISLRWDEMATHAGVRLLLRKVVHDTGEKTFLRSMTLKSRTPSQLETTSPLEATDEILPSPLNVPEQPQLCATMGQQQQPQQQPPIDEGASSRIEELLEAQAKEFGRVYSQLSDRFGAVEEAVGAMRALQKEQDERYRRLEEKLESLQASQIS